MPQREGNELRWSTKAALKKLERIAVRPGLTRGERKAVERAALALIVLDSSERLTRLLQKLVRGMGKPLSLAQLARLKSMGVKAHEMDISSAGAGKSR